MSERPVVLWFRQDLRLADNPALAAVEPGRPIVPVYVLDDETPGRWRIGGAGRWWLHGSLEALAGALAARGAPLVLRRGRAAPTVADLARQVGATAVHAGAAFEPHWRDADAETEAALADHGIPFHRFPGASLFPPGAIRGRQGGPIKVFTPFWKACLAAAPPPAPVPAPDRLTGLDEAPASEALDTWRLRPSAPDWAGGLRETWTPGEDAARDRLADFLERGVGEYAGLRDRPEPSATSGLSPHLHFGEVSAAQMWHATRQRAAGEPTRTRGSEAFLRELGWREFCLHTLDANPDMAEAPLQPRFGGFPWAEDAEGLRAWQRGRTGYPIVDAGMRQLWHTGWMHNRVRMIAASFLVKDLLVPWQAGEAWFWDTLVDADLANNAGGWQWVAGCGTDAAPYFRVFNPVLQGEKFDAGGAYVRRWVPELARLPDRWLQRPWDAPAAVLDEAGVRLGDTYPSPIVDHGAARRRALAAFETLKAAG